jgi:hypothetical protein
VQKYLSPIVRDHEMPTMTARQEEEPLGGVFVIDDHRIGVESPMLGEGQDRIELGLRQSHKKARLKLIGKTEDLISGRQFAGATHSILSIAYPQHSLGIPARLDGSYRIENNANDASGMPVDGTATPQACALPLLSRYPAAEVGTPYWLL